MPRFRLAHAAAVHVLVQQLAPACKFVGSYVAQGRRGLNVLRLHKRVHAQTLRRGIYRFVGTTGDRRVFALRVRLTKKRKFVRVPSAARVLACAPTGEMADVLALNVGTAPTASLRGATSAEAMAPGAFTPPRTSDRPWLDENPIVRALNPANAPLWLRPLLFVLLTLSIALLATGSVPLRALPAGPVAVAVVRNRAYVVGAGITLLVIVAVVTTFS
jgi:hypothetical protein